MNKRMSQYNSRHAFFYVKLALRTYIRTKSEKHSLYEHVYLTFL